MMMRGPRRRQSVFLSVVRVEETYCVDVDISDTLARLMR